MLFRSKLVIKTLLSFLYILKWKAMALIIVIFTIGGLHDNRGVWDFRAFRVLVLLLLLVFIASFRGYPLSPVGIFSSILVKSA